MDCFIFEIQRTLYSNNRNYVLTYANNKRIYNKLLLETARRAFFKKGFKAVSMREISKLSGIGLSNIYNYYPCKDDLLADVLHPLWRR